MDEINKLTAEKAELAVQRQKNQIEADFEAQEGTLVHKMHIYK